MRDYNRNGEVDKEDYILHEQMIEEQEKMASEAKHHSIGEYIGAFFIPLTLPPSFGHDKRKVFSLFRIFLFYCFFLHKRALWMSFYLLKALLREFMIKPLCGFHPVTMC